MSSNTRPLQQKFTFSFCFAVFCVASATMVASAEVPQNLGELGNTYSLRMANARVDDLKSHDFLSDIAVQNAKLSSIFGSGYSDPGEQGSMAAIGVNFGHPGQGFGYSYWVNTAAAPSPSFGNSGVTHAFQSQPGGYSYCRDIENELWWAEPGRVQEVL